MKKKTKDQKLSTSTDKTISNIMLDWETADAITKANLKATLQSIKEDLDNYYNDSQWLHEEDVILYEKTKRSIEFLLSRYYGE
jgi:hypothetical protein